MNSTDKILLSVVIPAFNEVENYQRGALKSVVSYFKKQKYGWEILLVNDGSTDETLKCLKEFAKANKGFKVVDIEHGGKVAAVTAGVRESKGSIVLFTDFDQSTPIEEVEKVIEQIHRGADVVIGNRGDVEGWSTGQKFRSFVFNLLVQCITLPGISDTQCGFKAFKNDVGQKLFDNLKVTYHTQKGGYMGAFDVELLFLARRLGYKISQIPVEWKYYKSNRLTWTEPFKMLRDVIKVRLFDLSDGYHKSSKDEIPRGWGYHLVPIILLIILTIPAFKDTWKVGYFPMHDDLQMMRQLVIDKCFQDGQIPCRWSQDMGYGFGYPIFNFYPPLPYYIGQLFHWMGLAFNDTIKALVVLNFILSGLTMYLLTKEFWGRWGGMISGVFYVYAPYHAVDLYARGAFNEAYSLVWMPAVFWAIYKLATTNQWRYVPLLSLFTGLMMLSHNPILMIFAPGALLWAAYWFFQKVDLKLFGKFLAAGILGVGIAAFFTLPVIFEQKYVHIESLVSGYFNYLAHFVTVNQLFFDDRLGYGDSRFGPIDDFSFQVGLFHWILSMVSLLVGLLLLRKKPKLSLAIILVFGLTLFYTFMSHEKSSFIWSNIKSLEYLQFPWRFLTLSIFGTSFLAGSVALLTSYIRSSVLRNTFLILVVLFAMWLYKDFFKWKDHWPWVDDKNKFSGQLWQMQLTSGIFDYLPKWAPLPPPYPPNGNAEFIEGQGEYQTLFKNSINQEYKIITSEESVFQINTFYFPGWRYYVNDREVVVNPSEDEEVGRPRIHLSQGEYNIKAILTNTPVRLFGNIFSLGAWIVVLGWIIKDTFLNWDRSLKLKS